MCEQLSCATQVRAAPAALLPPSTETAANLLTSGAAPDASAGCAHVDSDGRCAGCLSSNQLITLASLSTLVDVEPASLFFECRSEEQGAGIQLAMGEAWTSRLQLVTDSRERMARLLNAANTREGIATPRSARRVTG